MYLLKYCKNHDILFSLETEQKTVIHTANDLPDGMQSVTIHDIPGSQGNAFSDQQSFNS